jgi:hypothetical protein
MSRLPHASRATIAAKYQGGQDISLAYLRECFILDPASPSGAGWALPQTCGRNGTRATPGSPPGRRTAKGYFLISLTLGGRKRFLRVHRTVSRIDRAGLPAKSTTGRSRFQQTPVEPPWACRCGRSPAKPGWRHLRPRRNLPLGGRSEHARDEMTEVLLSDRTGARRATEVVSSCFEW